MDSHDNDEGYTLKYDGQWRDIKWDLYWKLYALGSSVEGRTVPEIAEEVGSSAHLVNSCFYRFSDYFPYRPMDYVDRDILTDCDVLRGVLSECPMDAKTLSKASGFSSGRLKVLFPHMTDLAYDDDSYMYFLVDRFEEHEPYLLSNSKRRM